MKRKIPSLILLLLVCLVSNAQISPNAKIRTLANDSTIFIEYRQKGKWRPIVSMRLQVRGVAQSRRGKAYYEIIDRKHKECINAYLETFYRLKGGNEFCIRVYNDGVAWQGVDSVEMDFTSVQHWWLTRSDDGVPTATDIESGKAFVPTDTIEEGQHFVCPALMNYGSDYYALLTESGFTTNSIHTHLSAKKTFGRLTWHTGGDAHSGWGTLLIGKPSDMEASTITTYQSAAGQAIDVKPSILKWLHTALYQ